MVAIAAGVSLQLLCFGIGESVSSMTRQSIDEAVGGRVKYAVVESVQDTKKVRSTWSGSTARKGEILEHVPHIAPSFTDISWRRH